MPLNIVFLLKVNKKRKKKGGNVTNDGYKN